MALVAKTHQDRLDTIKKNVRNAYEAFKPNYDRFNEFRRFTFDTSLTADDITLLTQLSKPQIEFNITEAYISRLMGEFSKQEPAISVSSQDQDKVDPLTIHVVEAHIRHILLDSKNHHTRWELMKDIYSGGFSVAKIKTDYAHEMSFDQILEYDRVYDPTLCGWDQLARYSHKGDGKFCFELFPYEVEDFKETYPGVKIDKLSYNRNFTSYNWAYLNGNEKILLVCDYYEKKKREVKIVQLADGSTKTLKEYESMIENWDDVVQPPAIKGKPRWTTLETICRYRCIETEVIEYVETDYKLMPLIFFDGNSIMLRNPKTSGSISQMTRPYVYNAKGAQKLKNFSGITLANEIENIVQHKFMVAKEALPKEEDFRQAYIDIQRPNNMVFNAFYENNPEQQIPNPIREIQRVPTPPEVIQAFTATDSLIQNILGSYDASLGINDNQLSGIAIVEGATQSNAAAMPYIVGFLQGLNRVAECFLDLIPKYYVTPRTIPIRGLDGKADYVKINQDDGIDMFYDNNVLNINVEAGVSFQIQKSKALQQIISLMQVSPLFNQFINDKGLGVLLDNVEIKGIDQLKIMVEDWQKEMQQQKQMAMQQQQQQMMNNPVIAKQKIEMAKLQQQDKEAQIDAQLHQAEIMQKQQEHQLKAAMHQSNLAMDMEKLKQDQLKTLADIAIAKTDADTQRIKAQAEHYAKQVELAIKSKDMHHNHVQDIIESSHKINSTNQYSDQLGA